MGWMRMRSELARGELGLEIMLARMVVVAETKMWSTTLGLLVMYVNTGKARTKCTHSLPLE